MYLTNYPIHMLLVAVFQEYHKYTKNNGIADRIALEK
jgi:hypothetical protein